MDGAASCAAAASFLHCPVSYVWLANQYMNVHHSRTHPLGVHACMTHMQSSKRSVQCSSLVCTCHDECLLQHTASAQESNHHSNACSQSNDKLRTSACHTASTMQQEPCSLLHSPSIALQLRAQA